MIKNDYFLNINVSSLGVHYASGHVFDMKAITEVAHKKVSHRTNNYYC